MLRPALDELARATISERAMRANNCLDDRELRRRRNSSRFDRRGLALRLSARPLSPRSHRTCSKAPRLCFDTWLSTMNFRRSRPVSLAVTSPIRFLAARFTNLLSSRLTCLHKYIIGWILRGLQCEPRRACINDGRYLICRRLRPARGGIFRRDKPRVKKPGDA